MPPVGFALVRTISMQKRKRTDVRSGSSSEGEASARGRVAVTLSRAPSRDAKRKRQDERRAEGVSIRFMTHSRAVRGEHARTRLAPSPIHRVCVVYARVVRVRVW